MAFCGRVSSHDPSRRLDRGIARAVFALLDMAGGLVEHHAVGDALLDEQELPVALAAHLHAAANRCF